MTRLRSALLGFVGFAVAVGGCNAILDNQPGRLKEEAPATPGVDKGSDGGRPPSDDAPGPPGDPPAGEDPEPECAPSARLCGGACVSLDDPAYGCGRADCEPCPAKHGLPICRAGGCAIGACDPGFADCNHRAEDGCEVDLSRAASCGACDVACPASRPVCAPSADTFVCTTGCTLAAPLLCGTECVSPLTSPAHCGDCNVACAEVGNGTAACVNGACTFTCKPGFRACGGRCVVATDPTACGPACLPCPAVANAAAICLEDACGIRCNKGYGDCNLDPRDGCETDLTTDPLHCGACGAACAGGACEDGVCRPEPPRDAAAPDAAPR